MTVNASLSFRFSSIKIETRTRVLLALTNHNINIL